MREKIKEYKTKRAKKVNRKERKNESNEERIYEIDKEKLKLW